MPKDYLFPAVPSIPSLVALTANRAFTAQMLGAVVELAGFTLNLAAVSGHGVFNLVGPGSYSGLLSGSVASGQTLAVSVNGGNFAVSGGGAAGISIIRSATPPSDTSVIWFDTESGTSLVWYVDAWVETSSASGGESGNVIVALTWTAYGLLTAEQQNDPTKTYFIID